ncbi:hypothetical protein RchiOBHm_Chr5g0070301 [Rosa chinensis]|uniref:Uncharacterized protein n=1 Tax=Rosa chinensis TaxID=74649 RepID=A0A2P6QK62_ROSCH|nr:hypothetical protein RchiOBHm_Chr5g0070301 [Rosa chinensis]
MNITCECKLSYLIKHLLFLSYYNGLVGSRRVSYNFGFWVGRSFDAREKRDVTHVRL